jgi:hypothetical protein
VRAAHPIHKQHEPVTFVAAHSCAIAFKHSSKRAGGFSVWQRNLDIQSFTALISHH